MNSASFPSSAHVSRARIVELTSADQLAFTLEYPALRPTALDLAADVRPVLFEATTLPTDALFEIA